MAAAGAEGADKTMNDAKIRTFRDQLLALRRAKLMLQGPSPSSNGEPNAMTGDAADAASYNDDQEQSLTLRGEEKRSFEEIEAALARIDSGEYGICEECGAAIPEKRLQVMPQARLCVPCQERREGEFPT